MPTVYSPPITTYTALATTTTSGNATSVTFSNLSGYRDYILHFDRLYTNSAGGENIYMEINGDTTTSNYKLVTMWGLNNSYGSTTRTDAASIIVGYNTGPSSTQGMDGTLHFIDAGATNKNKTILARTNNAELVRTGAAATLWTNNNAISSIKLRAETTYFQNGAIFSLFGVAS